MSFPTKPRVQNDPIISWIYHHKLNISRLSINNREWDDDRGM
ncbi:hypothetical protein [Calothrix sp. NIES-2098]